MPTGRLQTGIPPLDALLGGGLLPGTLTVVMGATGIGKTQFGLQFAHHGTRQEGEPGFLFDMTTRGDSQNHADYARRLFGWDLRAHNADANIPAETVWDRERIRADYVHLFDRSGRRVTIGDLEPDDWREWKIELSRKLERAVASFYGNFIHGVRRCVIDGMEPTDKAADSFQMHVFDYIYHQILHKDCDWVARDLFRAQFRANAEIVERHRYEHESIGCLLLLTTHAVMLDDLIGRPIQSGDALSNANTIIQMGRVRNGTRVGRALCVAKHRGSYCEERIVPFEITENGLELRSTGH
ncbi:MAG: RAD55 family ATPase [Planctomycetaceae bacterium]